jgi:NAD(P)-dependent dehydrogenase (short-subunit alcohol dehydrogenase family)
MSRLPREEMLLHDGGLFPLAEGACALVLKRQDDAHRDNNHIHALIQGISCRQGTDMAATTKATVESSVSNLEAVSFLELASPCNTPGLREHMTALTEMFSSLKREIPMGSLANQLGNLLGASGIASVIKAILQLKRGTPRPCALVTNVDRDGGVCSLVIERTGNAPRSVIISREEFVALNTSVDGKPPIDAGTTVCRRFVQRIVPAPLETNTLLQGPVLLVGQNAVLEHLHSLIEQSGGTPHRLHPAAPDEPMLRRFNTLFDKEPIRHIVFLTSHDQFRREESNDKLDSQIWQKTLIESVYRPFRLLQHWFGRIKDAGLLEQASVVMSTLMGGDFGYTQSVGGPEGGAAQGLMKALRREWNVQENILFRSRVIDHHQDVPAEKIATDLFQELHAHDLEMEIGYVDHQRYTSRPILAPLDARKIGELETSAKHQLTGNWIFTGGAQGITAVCAREFGKRFGGKLHLIGSTNWDHVHSHWSNYDETQLQNVKKQVMKDALMRKEIPGDAWRRVEKSLDIEKNLSEMLRLGIDVSYHACDLTDESSVRKMVESIVSADGSILGVIHGAGFESACRFERKKQENIARTFEVKVGGAANLLRCLDRRSLKYFIGFGSTSGRFGGVGQSDYSATNEMLAKLLAWYHSVNPGCQTACMQWTAWGDVGMAVRPESKSALTSMNRTFLPPLEGAKHLLDELVLGLPESEVTIVDWEYYKRFFPDGGCQG